MRKMFRLVAIALLVLMLMSFGSAAAAPVTGKNAFAVLSGDQEVPPVQTQARGLAWFHLSHDGTALHYKLIVANIEDVTAAHIHLAPVGENGPVVAFLYPEDGSGTALIEGRFSGVLAQGVITADDLIGPLADGSLQDLLDEMQAGNTYVNVHTLAHPGGEIRGQINVLGPQVKGVWPFAHWLE